MTIDPAPSELRSRLISVRDLFGCAFRTSIVPEISPAGVDTIIVPAVDREVSFPRAAVPPRAVRVLSTISSAVWAEAMVAELKTSTTASNRFDIIVIGYDSCWDGTSVCDRFQRIYAVPFCEFP